MCQRDGATVRAAEGLTESAGDELEGREEVLEKARICELSAVKESLRPLRVELRNDGGELAKHVENLPVYRKRVSQRSMRMREETEDIHLDQLKPRIDLGRPLALQAELVPSHRSRLHSPVDAGSKGGEVVDDNTGRFDRAVLRVRKREDLRDEVPEPTDDLAVGASNGDLCGNGRSV